MKMHSLQEQLCFEKKNSRDLREALDMAYSEVNRLTREINKLKRRLIADPARRGPRHGYSECPLCGGVRAIARMLYYKKQIICADCAPDLEIRNE